MCRSCTKLSGPAHGSPALGLPARALNDPPTNVLLVLKMKFLAKIFALYSRR